MRRIDLLASCAAFTAVPAMVRAQALTPLRIAGGVGWTMSEGYFGRSGNFFVQAGLDVTETDLSNGGAVTAALLGGAVDIGLTNVGSACSAYAHGIPIGIIAPGIAAATSSRPTTVIAVMPDSTIRGPRDLAGKTLCVTTLHDLQQAAVMNWIERGGGDPKATNYIEIPPPAMSPALREHRVDAAALTEPWLAVIRPEMRAIGAPYESLGNEILLSAWIANRSWIAGNREVVAKFTSAIRQTARWGNGHQAAMLKMLETQTKIQHGVTARMGLPVLGERLDVAMIQPIIDACARYGFLSKSFPASEMIVS